MKANGLFARIKRKFKTTTDSNHKYPIVPNILNQNFKVSIADQVWVSDITYIETKQGWMYLTVIIDLFNPKAGRGWSMGDTLTTQDTIIAAWNMPITLQQLQKNLFSILIEDPNMPVMCLQIL